MSALESALPDIDHDGITTSVTTAYANHYAPGTRLWAVRGNERAYLGEVIVDKYHRHMFGGGDLGGGPSIALASPVWIETKPGPVINGSPHFGPDLDDEIDRIIRHGSEPRPHIIGERQ